MTAYAFCGQLALLQDKVEEASQWLEMSGDQEVHGADDVLGGPTHHHSLDAACQRR